MFLFANLHVLGLSRSFKNEASAGSSLEECKGIFLDACRDPNFKIESDGLQGSALYEEGFAYCWSGARATIGITGGKYCFGCKVISLQPVEMDDTPPDQQHVCRLGISRGDSPVGNLGETKQSFGFGGTGKFSNAGKFSDYGEKFGIGDTIVCAVNLESKPLASIGFSKNGKWLGTAIQFDAGPRGLGVVDSPLRKLQRESAFFPHVLLKNVVVQLQFSVEEGLAPEEGFKPWASALDDNNALLGPTFSNVRDCEVMMMVGLPASGKSTWAKKWVDDHPEKRYVLLGTNLILDQMKLPGLLRKHNYGERFDRLMDRATGIFNVLLSRAASIPRNYIIDQTNVYKNARRRKLKPFADFQKIAVVVFPKPEELQCRSAKRSREMGKEVPADAVNDMLANYILPTSKDVPGSGEYFDEVIFVELDRAESQRCLDGMKRALTSESHNFMSHSQASPAPPHILPSRNQGLHSISNDERYGSSRFISEVHQENMNSPLSRFVPPYRSNDNLISETRYSGPSSHPPVRSYLGFDPYSIGGHFRGDDRMCPPREYSDIASPFPRMGEMPPREYSDVAYPFPPTGPPYGSPPPRPTYQFPSNMPYGRGYASPRPSPRYY
ncbi:heterogeneous nuclear ribonucleoprotein U-like protein 1 isoform X2 [Momordica charantia]|uniref:Heterogeneous nuclear ribonucleoprotein U-like protein 1 isoform X2 n=1 Tax=Momordica charantia TaxID=3673 RepID=A0A6J1CE66_MOMCH|nr:heterogeneous nuclear ribonucleoprotein U-like protein 1 isoform X2 [Momordica charantia]